MHADRVPRGVTLLARVPATVLNPGSLWLRNIKQSAPSSCSGLRLGGSNVCWYRGHLQTSIFSAWAAASSSGMGPQGSQQKHKCKVSSLCFGAWVQPSGGTLETRCGFTLRHCFEKLQRCGIVEAFLLLCRRWCSNQIPAFTF